MSQKVQELSDFIERAVKSRKYPESTAQGLRAALKLFESVLNHEEKESLDLFKKNIDPIYQSVATKYGREYSAGSLAAYKSRVLKIVSDFEKYGNDATKMASWSPKIIKRSPRKKADVATEIDNTGGSIVPPALPGMHKIELALRSDTKFLIMVPMDITKTECAMLKAVLDSLTGTAESK